MNPRLLLGILNSTKMSKIQSGGEHLVEKQISLFLARNNDDRVCSQSIFNLPVIVLSASHRDHYASP